MKNIGGSIFPSSSPEVLAVVKFGGSCLWPGDLQVVPDVAQDTHHLMLINGKSRTVLASHPNGHSCHLLAKRMADQDRPRSNDQAIYIIACGGSITAVGASIISGLHTKKL